MSFLDALQKMAARFDELDRIVAEPEVIADHARYTALLKERGGLADKVAAYRRWQAQGRELDEARELLRGLEDAEEVALIEAEVASMERKLGESWARLRETFVTDDEDANRDVILEIRAGTGGDEAALFAGDLMRMYAAFADSRGWRREVLDASEGTFGGYKEIVVNLVGEGVYKHLRYESGGHRVQRVPETESQGRIHTSAATVAVLAEASEVEVEIRDADLRIDAFRSSGPGGQSVNKTSSAIRVTHLPTGIVVSCQDEKSQHKNKAKALKILRSRIYDAERQKAESARSSERRAMIGSGDRSERIRTYNFPQNRVTDHRIGLTLYSLDRVMEGELDQLVDPLIEHDRELKLQALDT